MIKFQKSGSKIGKCSHFSTDKSTCVRQCSYCYGDKALIYKIFIIFLLMWGFFSVVTYQSTAKRHTVILHDVEWDIIYNSTWK